VFYDNRFFTGNQRYTDLTAANVFSFVNSNNMGNFKRSFCLVCPAENAVLSVCISCLMANYYYYNDDDDDVVMVVVVNI